MTNHAWRHDNNMDSNQCINCDLVRTGLEEQQNVPISDCPGENSVTNEQNVLNAMLRQETLMVNMKDTLTSLQKQLNEVNEVVTVLSTEIHRAKQVQALTLDAQRNAAQAAIAAQQQVEQVQFDRTLQTKEYLAQQQLSDAAQQAQVQSHRALEQADRYQLARRTQNDYANRTAINPGAISNSGV